MAGGEGGVHDLAEDFERLVGSARSGAAVGVEPAFDVGPPDGVQRQAAEGRDQLPFKHTIGGSEGRLGAAAAVSRQPLVQDEVAEQGNTGTSFRLAWGGSPAERQGCLPGVLDGHERGRAEVRLRTVATMPQNHNGLLAKVRRKSRWSSGHLRVENSARREDYSLP